MTLHRLGHSQAVRHRVLIHDPGSIKCPATFSRLWKTTVLSMPQPLAMQSPSKKSTRRPLFLVKETIEYADQVEKLIDTTFAADIQSRPVYRYRKPSARIEPLCKIALDPKGKVQGCIRFFKCGLIKEDGTLNDAVWAPERIDRQPRARTTHQHPTFIG